MFKLEFLRFEVVAGFGLIWNWDELDEGDADADADCFVRAEYKMGYEVSLCWVI